MRRKQPVGNGVWYIGGGRRSRKGQKGEFFVNLIGSFEAPLIAEIAKPILKKIVGGRRRRHRWYA